MRITAVARACTQAEVRRRFPWERVRIEADNAGVAAKLFSSAGRNPAKGRSEPTSTLSGVDRMNNCSATARRPLPTPAVQRTSIATSRAAGIKQHQS